MDVTIVGLAIISQIFIYLYDSVSSIPTFWCPAGRYPTETGLCELCYENCGALGCTGPGTHLGPGGCSSCWLGLQNNQGNTTCISPFSVCPSRHYQKTEDHEGHQMTMCKACHPLCATCSGPGVSYCDTCRYYRWDGICVRVCPSNSMVRRRHRMCVTLDTNYGRRRPFYLHRDMFWDQS